MVTVVRRNGNNGLRTQIGKGLARQRTNKRMQICTLVSRPKPNKIIKKMIRVAWNANRWTNGWNHCCHFPHFAGIRLNGANAASVILIRSSAFTKRKQTFFRTQIHLFSRVISVIDFCDDLFQTIQHFPFGPRLCLFSLSKKLLEYLFLNDYIRLCGLIIKYLLPTLSFFRPLAAHSGKRTATFYSEWAHFICETNF